MLPSETLRAAPVKAPLSSPVIAPDAPARAYYLVSHMVRLHPRAWTLFALKAASLLVVRSAFVARAAA